MQKPGRQVDLRHLRLSGTVQTPVHFLTLVLTSAHTTLKIKDLKTQIELVKYLSSKNELYVAGERGNRDSEC